MVRGAEWTAPPDLAAAEFARDGRYHRDLERLGRLQRRQNARKTCREQRLSGSRRAAHQQIVPASGRDLERPFGDFLPLHLGEIGSAFRRVRLGERWWRNQARAFQVREQGEQVRRRDHVQLARPRGLRALRGRADQTLLERGSVNGREEHARRRRDAAVEAELSDGDIVR
jgi:hypothetical protein